MLGHAHDQKWIADVAQYVPELLYADEYQRLYERFNESRASATDKAGVPSGRQKANWFLSELVPHFERPDIIYVDDDEIRAAARRYSFECSRLMQSCDSWQAAEAAGLQYARERGITSPTAKTSRGIVNRLASETFWRRRLRVKFTQKSEAAAMRAGLVCSWRQNYCSNLTLDRRRKQRQRNSELLESMIATNQDGDEYTLSQLAASSVSNPENRRNELMTRMRGIEDYANRVGHVALFITLTCPSRFHACGGLNSNYDGSTPADAQRYLSKITALARSELGRNGIRPYGIRVAEPHKDACPHWHYVVFMPREHVSQYRHIMRAWALADTPDEPGAAVVRFKCVAINKKRGSATGYVAKYVSKNIDGYKLDDVNGDAPALACERIEAWARAWNIRQFQLFGGPAVTIWRELRRLRSVDDAFVPDDIARAWSAADSGDYEAFIRACGGVRQVRVSVEDCEARLTLIDAQLGHVSSLDDELLSARDVSALATARRRIGGYKKESTRQRKLIELAVDRQQRIESRRSSLLIKLNEKRDAWAEKLEQAKKQLSLFKCSVEWQLSDGTQRPKCTAFGDESAPVTLGVQNAAGQRVVTRLHNWEIESARSESRIERIAARHDRQCPSTWQRLLGFFFKPQERRSLFLPFKSYTWSTVNNCTLPNVQLLTVSGAAASRKPPPGGHLQQVGGL